MLNLLKIFLCRSGGSLIIKTDKIRSITPNREGRKNKVIERSDRNKIFRFSPSSQVFLNVRKLCCGENKKHI